MYLDMDLKHFAANVTKFSTRKLQLHGFFGRKRCTRKGNMSAPKASEMILTQLLVHDSLNKS
ncbi:MAG: hypothetical protein COB20_07350 [SAR86 cluster bacterium]|uniref:Uncharacterized protein n=1 Tax=SAR86 cluster bacterium TaxID=2030880 RepID=A0A2A4X5D1_9GAMM|nr:MAG: hypothetical protein COB20_07350 [SAR86 cluster bacterium]